MISFRSIVLSTLIALPLLIFAGVGGYAIWQNGTLHWVWWLMSGCGLAAWGLSVFWKPQSAALVRRHQIEPAGHWTPRDRTRPPSCFVSAGGRHSLGGRTGRSTVLFEAGAGTRSIW